MMEDLEKPKESKRAKVRPAWADAFNRRLDIALGRSGLNRNKLSNQMGIGRSSASEWYRSTMPSADNLVSISTLLNVPIDWLVGRGPDQIPMSDAAHKIMDGEAMSLASAAAAEFFIQARKLPSPDGIAHVISSAYGWLLEEKAEKGAIPSFEAAVRFLRHGVNVGQGGHG